MTEKFVMDNGVTIVMESMPFVRSISLGIFIKNGSCYEDSQTNGISHFIEHMLFKGTKNRTANQIADEIDSIGGEINAFTAKECTCYYTMTLDNNFDKSFDILSDMFFNSIFDDNEIKKELNVIAEEINMYHDNPEDLLYENLERSVWKNSPIGLPILGSIDIISKFNSETFKKYINKHYRPNNTIISVAGNFKKDYIIKKVESYFGSWKCDNSHEEIYNIPEYFPSKIKTEKNTEQLHMLIAFRGIPYSVENSFTLTALNTIFGGGVSSKLFQKIREEYGLAYSIYSFSSNFLKAGLFGVYAALNPKNYYDAYNHIFNEIDKIRKETIKEEQLLKTKERLKTNFILGLESSNKRMMNIGRNQLLLNRVITTDEILKKVDEITPQKITEIANKVLDIDTLSISVVGRVGSINI